MRALPGEEETAFLGKVTPNLEDLDSIVGELGIELGFRPRRLS